MIKSLQIENIQSHKKSLFEFSPGVNVIIGTSDSGKSAALRAIRLVVENRPLGNSIVSHWADSGVITIETDTTKVVRSVGKQNYYTVQGVESPFKAFGTTVPQEITDALNIGQINLQKQLDSPFLLSDSPGAVAEHFNKIAHLEVIDIGLQRINQNLNKLKSDITYTKEQLDGNKIELNQFEYLEKMEIDLEVLEEMESQKTALSKQVSSLDSLINSILLVEANIESVKDLIVPEADVDRVLSLIERKNRIKLEIECLGKDVQQLKKSEETAMEYQNKIKAEESVNAVLVLIDSKNKFKRNIEILETELYNIRTTEKNIHVKSKALTAMIKELHDNMPDVCPLCEQEIIH